MSVARPEIIDITHAAQPADGCEAVFRVTHAPSKLTAFIALHHTADGPGVGGVRRRRYATERHAIADATSLAAQMTRKVRFAELPCGGGKSVILDHPELDHAAAYEAFGEAVTALGGRYFCGPDVGTGDRELGFIRRGTNYTNAPENDASEATARGVLAGLKAVIAHRWPAGIPAGTPVVVQGTGRVGSRVVRGLPSGLSLTIADPDTAAVEALCADIPGLSVVAPEAALTVPCEILSPCAVGPVVTEVNLATLPARVVCGSANTQLGSDALADRLAERGVLYVPDFIVNAGAVVEGVLVLFADPALDAATLRSRVEARIDGIEDRLREVLDDAAASGRTPLAVALDRLG